jgi:hypothetical protein
MALVATGNGSKVVELQSEFHNTPHYYPPQPTQILHYYLNYVDAFLVFAKLMQSAAAA